MRVETRNLVLGYAVAALAVAGAVLLRWLLDPVLGDHMPLATLYGAVAIAAWYGGYRPALLVVALGYLACDYLFIEPRGSFGLNVARNLVGLLAYLVSCGFIVGFAETVRVTQRRSRQYQQVLHEQREWLRTTLASIGDAVITTDANGRVTLANGVAQQLTGWTQDAAFGLPLEAIFQIINEHTRQPVENPVQRVLREGRTVGLANHTVLIARDGRERPIDDSGAPIRTAKGDVGGVVLVFRDITERRRLERENAERAAAARLLASIVESSHDAIVSKSLDGIIQTWNSAAEQLFGYTAEQAVGRPITLIIPPERADEEDQIIARIRAGQRVDHFDTVRLRSDGQPVHVSLTISPVRDEGGRIVGASKIARDIAERKQAEAALGESERRFRTLAGHAPVGIFQTDAEGNCLFVNERWCAMAGMSPEQARGQGWVNALHPEDRDRIRQEWYESAQAGQEFASEYRFRTPQGEIAWLSGSAVVLRDEVGQVTGYIGTVTDITERKQAEQELQDADRRKDEFLATLAHELRNPLAPIRNALELLRREDGHGTVAEQSRKMMERQVGQMVRLIDDLIDVSRISRGKIDLRRQRVELEVAVRSAVEATRPLVEAEAHELTVALPPEPIYLDADQTRLTQVFSNLINNAAKYTESGGHIWLSAERQGGEVAVSVRDTGIGIPAEHLPRLFEMFSQVAPALERSQGGLGVGLSLVRGLVRLHGGSVEAHSGGPGRGSEFIVRLPVTDDSVPRAAPEEREVGSEPHRGPKSRILVVDDNRDAADSLATMLRMMGNDVRTAYDGLEAVQAAATFRPDVLLLDIGLPRMNGYEAARHIREQPWGRSMALIALTGWGQEEDRRRALDAGCDHHLTKPADPAALQKLLALITPVPQQ
jgi:PAS domain S-box-containing protein